MLRRGTVNVTDHPVNLHYFLHEFEFIYDAEESITDAVKSNYSESSCLIRYRSPVKSSSINKQQYWHFHDLHSNFLTLSIALLNCVRENQRITCIKYYITLVYYTWHIIYVSYD